jgi:hypothetical protein
MIPISYGINQVALYQLKVKYAVHDITRDSTIKFYLKEAWSGKPSSLLYVRWGPMVPSCEHSYETSRFLQDGEFLEQLIDC